MKASVLLLLCLVSLEVMGRRTGGGSRSSGSSSRSSSSRSSRGSSGGSYSSGSSSSSRGSGSSSRSSSGSSSGSSRGSSGSSNVPSNNWGTSSRGSGSSSRSSGTSRSSNSRYTPTKTYQGPKNYGYSKNPSQFNSNSYGYSSSSGKGLSYRSPGYGTNWGTSFGSGSHRVGRNGYSKKALGLGVAAGFVGGAAIGGAATYGVYHRYNEYRSMMYRGGYGSYGSYYGGSYYNDYYLRDQCMFGCPGFAVCRYGFCECPYGMTRRYGRCSRDWSRDTYRRPPKFDPLSATCTNSEHCWEYDQNLICPEEKQTTAGTAKCQCRTDMKWNSQESQCELYLDVDCSKITYDTPVDPLILEAVKITIARVNQTEENAGATNILVAGNETDAAVKNETVAAAEAEEAAKAAETKSIGREATLDNSLLKSIDPKKASQDQITEAYCRDVDSLSFEFQTQEDPRRGNGGGMGVGGIIGIIILVLLLTSCCCLCAICCACKGVLDCCKKKGGSRAPSPVGFTAVQEHEEMQPVQNMNMNSGPDQPGYPSATQSYNPAAATQSYQPIYPPMNQ